MTMNEKCLKTINVFGCRKCPLCQQKWYCQMDYHYICAAYDLVLPYDVMHAIVDMKPDWCRVIAVNIKINDETENINRQH